MIHRVETPARCGILGNPSDGFFGKTIAAPVRNFYASVILFEWDTIEILPGRSDHANFSSIDELIKDIEVNGYYGGLRLIKAAIKQFHDYAKEYGYEIPPRNFSIRYSSNIPRQVGLAGSSAIITSTMKALSAFYRIPMKKEIMANHVLWSETKELGIPAGLQDRVVQVYDTPVYMDFDRDYMERHGYGIYEPIPPDLFPPMYLAYRTTLTHKDTAHNDVRKRWLAGDKEVHETMAALGENAREGLDALKSGDFETFEKCLDRNFDLRASIYTIPEGNLKMIRLARKLGATAKFPGSGGAIIGTYKNEEHFSKLRSTFNKVGCEVVKIKFK